jgi:hypothetical protein
MGEEKINRNKCVNSNHRTVVVNTVINLRFPYEPGEWPVSNGTRPSKFRYFSKWNRIIPSKQNSSIQSSPLQYGYMFRSFLDHQL